MENRQGYASVGEKCILELFDVLRQMEEETLGKRFGSFKKSEMRVLSEIVAAENREESVCSMQLANKTGLTRSAISQIVIGLEQGGYIVRKQSKRDKKVFDLEIVESARETFDFEQEKRTKYFDEIMNRFGKENAAELLRLGKEFLAVVRGIGD